MHSKALWCPLTASSRSISPRLRLHSIRSSSPGARNQGGFPPVARQTRAASSSSSKRWQARQSQDKFTKEAQIQGLKSRAAFKLLEINERYKIFKKGQTVVDLGYAPGSWSQVAFDRTRPDGRVIGIDIIPSQPPRGVSTIQGNFLADAVQQQVKSFVRDPERGKSKEQRLLSSESAENPVSEEDLVQLSTTVLAEHDTLDVHHASDINMSREDVPQTAAEEKAGRVVDVVLSDMSAPWAQEVAYGKKSLSDPYFRMMNTSGNRFRDHAGSMDLCNAALKFSFDTLRTGGSFVCKYYQGSEEKEFVTRLKAMFANVHREKPASSRSESKEAYFVGMRRKADAQRAAVLGEMP